VTRLRRRLGRLAADHPRHVVLGAVVAGLLASAAPPVAVVAALALGGAAIGVPLTASRARALLLVAVALAAATAGAARTDAMERTALSPAFGTRVSVAATWLAAAREDGFGGRRALARVGGEPVLVRLPAGAESPGIGAIAEVAGRLAAPDLAARALRAHAVLRADAIVLTGRRRGGVLGLIDRVRARATAALDGPAPAAESGLLRGMVLGGDDGLDPGLRDAFRAAGLSHLVAASGANVALLATLALVLGAVVGLGITARRVLVLVLIGLYVPLAGAGPSIQRAGVMGAATLAAGLASRPASRAYAVLLAAAVTLALDPRSAGDVGWQLSFAAVLGILVLAPRATARLRRAGLPRLLAEAVALTAAATVATAPLIAWRFDRTSLVSLPANVLAAPVVGPIMALGFAAAAMGQVAPGLAAPLVAIASVPLGYLVWLARTAAGLPGAQAAVPPVAVAVLAVAAGAALARRPGTAVAPRSPRLRLAVALALAAALVAILPRALSRGGVGPPPAGVLRVTALDVGQGDATLLQADGHAVLVDAGPPGTGVVGALRRAGVARLDAVVVTHPQLDHDGGVPAVLAALPVGLVLDGRGGDRAPSSRAIDAVLARRPARVVPAQAGQRVRAGPLTLTILWPPAGAPPPGTDPNDHAVVALAGAHGVTALLTADAESPVLGALDLPAVDVLKVSHHGSADEGLPALLRRLRPRVALIEVGAHNRYGHPAAGTLVALAAAGVPVRRTDRDGSVRVDLRDGPAEGRDGD